MSETLSKGEDRISNLPDHIIDRIFSKLPIKDTGKTSLLSRKWRHKWKIVSSLVFEGVFERSYDPQRLTSRKFVTDIDRILLLHSGLICKFHLTDYQELPGQDIDNWILHLSRHPIKKFMLNLICTRNYKMTSCFFTCQNLTHLYLYNCTLNPQSTFKGFKDLKSLTLLSVSLKQDMFDILVSSCKLEKLYLADLFGVDHLNINAPKLLDFSLHQLRFQPNRRNSDQFNVDAPNLERFHFSGQIAKLNLKCSRIKVFTISIEFGELPDKSDNLLELFPNVSQLEKLIIYPCFELLDFGVIPRALPTPCRNLRYLLVNIDFTSHQWNFILLCLLRSVPNLQELVIISSRDVMNEARSDIWQADQRSYPLTRLRHVKITNFSGIPEEVYFFGFVLLSAPILMEMTVERDRIYWKNQSNKWKNDYQMLMQMLLSLKRASPLANIVFKD